MDIMDVGDSLLIDGNKFMANTDLNDIDSFDADSDVDLKDIKISDAQGMDISYGKPCTNIGVSSECAADESCYPFVECGGVCRRCGSSTVGSNCEIHSDCKCGMVCLSLTDKTLKCYKVCKDNNDCPAGQSCTDGWGIEYEHEYYKICKGAARITEEGK
jgi:hypothetical protein